MGQTEVFHPGEQAIQSRLGVQLRMAARGAQSIRSFMPEQHRAFFPLLPYLPVSVRDKDGWPVGTMLTGRPGFVSSPDPRILHVAALPHADDPAAGGFEIGAPIGILGIDLSTRRRNRLNGNIAALDADGFDVRVTQSFGNCAQYIQQREPLDVTPTRGAVQHLTSLDRAARTQIAQSDTFFVASGAGEFGLDMSHRGGRPGFVRVDGDVLTVPDFAGNRFFNTLGNFLLDPRAGLLFPDFNSGAMLQLKGRVTLQWDGPDVAEFHGAQRLWHVQVTRGWRIEGALPARWDFHGQAATTEATGLWRAGVP